MSPTPAAVRAVSPGPARAMSPSTRAARAISPRHDPQRALSPAKGHVAFVEPDFEYSNGAEDAVVQRILAVRDKAQQSMAPSAAPPVVDVVRCCSFYLSPCAHMDARSRPRCGRRPTRSRAPTTRR